MRGARLAAGGLLSLFSVTYVVGWIRAWSHVGFWRSYATAWEELLWLGTTVAVVLGGVLVLVTSIGLLLVREPRRWVTWSGLIALCAAGVLPAVRTMTTPRSDIPFMPDPFRDRGPAWALSLHYDDSLLWRGASLPFTLLAVLWAWPVVVAELSRSDLTWLQLGACIGAVTALTGAFLYSVLVVASMVAVAAST